MTNVIIVRVVSTTMNPAARRRRQMTKKFKCKWIAFRYWWRRKVSMPLGNRLVGLKTHKVVIHYNGNYYTAEYRRHQFFYELRPRICLRSILANRKQWYVTYWSNGSSPGPGGVEIMGAREPFIYGRGKELMELKVKMMLLVHITIYLMM